MPVSVRIESKALIDALDNVVKNLPKALGSVSKKTARHGRSQMAKMVQSGLNITQRDIKKDMFLAFPQITTAVLGMRQSRFSLKRFKAKRYGPRKPQGRKPVGGGVAWKKVKGGSKTKIPHAFIVPKLGGHVFIRGSKKIPPSAKKMREGHRGSRDAIFKLYGASPWGVMKADNRIPRLKKIIQARLREELEKSIRYNTLKQSGASLRGQ